MQSDTCENKGQGNRNKALRKYSFLKRLGQCVGGHSPYVTHFIGQHSQSSLCWFPLMFTECFFRSIGAVILASNPFSGAIIFLAMLIATPTSTLLASISLLSGIVTAYWIVRIPVDEIRNGSVTFNCYILGTMIGELAASTSVITDTPDVVPIAVCAGSLV